MPSLPLAFRPADRASAELELIVVDNASGRQVRRSGPRLVPGRPSHSQRGERWLRRGAQPGLRGARPEMPGCLLNPDARLEPDAVRPVVAVLRRPPAAAGVAPAIAGGGGRVAGSSSPEEPRAPECARTASAMGTSCSEPALPGDRGGAWRGFQLNRRPGLGPRRVEWASAAALPL